MLVTTVVNPFLLILTLFIQGNTSADAEIVFTKLKGAWSCQGTFTGKPAVGRAEFLVVNGRLHLEYQLGPLGKPYFTGSGSYHKAGKGVWTDSAGNAYVLKETFTSDSMATEWRDFERTRGYSLYRIVDANTLAITDEINSQDGRRPFTEFKCNRDSTNSR